MRPIVLDRDGVINVDSDQYIKSAKEWVPIEGSIEAIALLSNKGFNVFVATNQSGVGRGFFTEQTLAEMHTKLTDLVDEAGGRVSGIAYCPHLPEDNCNCRKPSTGLLSDIEARFQCSLPGAYFVGDSISDIIAAKTYGCVPILVRTGKGENTLLTIAETENNDIDVYSNLAEFAHFLLKST